MGDETKVAGAVRQKSPTREIFALLEMAGLALSYSPAAVL